MKNKMKGNVSQVLVGALLVILIVGGIAAINALPANVTGNQRLLLYLVIFVFIAVVLGMFVFSKKNR